MCKMIVLWGKDTVGDSIDDMNCKASVGVSVGKTARIVLGHALNYPLNGTYTYIYIIPRG